MLSLTKLSLSARIVSEKYKYVNFTETTICKGDAS